MFRDRRSVRRYKDREIEQTKLTYVLEAARWAPSWANSQCCELVVVQQKERKKELSLILSTKNPAILAVENAPVVIAVCAALKKAGYYNDKALTKFEDWFMYDLGLVTENICLAAHEQGLGTVIVGSFEHDRAAEILKIPQGYEVVAFVPLGYPDHNPPAPKRKAVDQFVHYEEFNTI